jgi:serine/threonine protein kinase
MTLLEKQRSPEDAHSVVRDSVSSNLDDYTFVRRLGAGANAEVWLAESKKNDSQKFAIKSYDKFKYAEPVVMEQLMTEMRVHARLEHPNITRLYTVIDTPERYHLILEYVKG